MQWSSLLGVVACLGSSLLLLGVCWSGVAVVVVVHGSETHEHMFTSYANLLKLYFMEEESLSNVDVFLREELHTHRDEASVDEAHNLTSVRKLVEAAKKTHKEVGEGGVMEYLSHPVNVFHLAQRLHRGWREAIDHIRNSRACREWHIPHVIGRLSNIEENLPSEADMASLAYNLMTIQHTQGIRTGDLLQGRVGQHVSVEPISLREQFRIVKEAVEEDDYYYAAQWLKYMSRLPELKDMTRAEDGFNTSNVFGMLASAYFRINMMPEALKATDDLLKKDPENMVARSNRVFYERKLAKQSQDGSSSGPVRPVRYGKQDVYRRNYEALCRGTHLKLSRHRCRLVPSWPGSRISFYKMEVLRRTPPVIALHDVILRQDADLIVNISNREYEKAAMDSEDGFKTPEFTLILSKVQREGSGKKNRDTFSQYLRVLQKIRTRFESLPYLATKPYVSGEPEARNFGHQGFYLKPAPGFEIHTMGGETGTALMFLNEVEMGGEMVFPSANVRVEPRVGTMVYYYPSLRKFHTLCPVAYGTEWILARSFYEKRSPKICRSHEDPELKK